MPTDVETLLVKLEGRITDFEKKMARANAIASSSAGKIQGSLSAAAGRANKALGLIGVGLTAGFLTSASRKAISEIGDLADAATQAGISAEGLQVFRFAIDQAGGSVEDADKALIKFNKNMGDLANTGKGSAADALKAIGINIEEAGFKSASTEEKFKLIVERLSGIKDQAKLAGIAGDIFGDKLGPKLLGVLAQGQSGLVSTEAAMRRLGQLMSNEAVAAGDVLDDKFKSWALTIETVFKKAVVGAAEAVSEAVRVFTSVSAQTDIAALRKDIEGYLNLRKSFSDQLRRSQSDDFFAFLNGDPESHKRVIRGIDLQIAEVETRIRELTEENRNRFIPVFSETDVDESVFNPPGNSEAEAAKKKIDEVTTSLEFQAAQLSRTAREQFIYNELQRAGVIESTAAGERVRTLAGHYYDLELATTNFRNALQSIGEQAFDSFEQVLDGAVSAGDAIKKLIRDLLLAEARSRFLSFLNPAQATTGPITALLGGLFGGGRAGGGGVSPGKVYRVGEDGEELFAPKVPGEIIPNNRIGGGTQVVIHQHNDFTNADPGAAARLEARLQRMQRETVAASTAAVAQAVGKSPRYLSVRR